MSDSGDGVERIQTAETQVPEIIRRRELKLGIQRVELRLYRRTRTSSDLVTKPPHFVYIIRCSWEGEQRPSTRPRFSPRSPRKGDNGFEEPWAWWDALPNCYTVRRRWHEIVRFHEALKHELANDPNLGCRRVKAKLPVLPDPADVDNWLKTYAATNDACALGRSATEVLHKDFAPCFHELGDLHWMYCHNRLAPYFAEASKVLEELPTEVLASSRSLRRFVTGGVSGRPPPSALPVPSRFMGKMVPTLPDADEISKVARAFRASKSTGSLPRPGRQTSASASAAAKLLMNSSSDP
mmetsp:Transcript_9615/g.16796  ORF Transcript_9615/g.16796 Transcript_9615/m.16796 type:complete len:296 (+) Transcript_9615:2-889(+)